MYDLYNSKISNKKIAIIVGVLIAIITATAIALYSRSSTDLDKPDTNDTNMYDQGNEADHADSTHGRTGIYAITGETVLEAISEEPIMASNMDTMVEESNFLEKSNESDTYTLNRIFSVTCLPKDSQSTFLSDFEMQITLEYKGENYYPSSLDITTIYSDTKDDETSRDIAYRLISNIVNNEVGSHMKNCTFGNQPEIAYNVGEDIYVTVSKLNEPMENSDNKNFAAYTVEIKQNNSTGYYTNIDAFKSEDNPNMGLFEAGILQYGNTMSGSLSTIEELFGENAEAKLITISNYSKKYGDNTQDNSYGSWEATIEDKIGYLEASTYETNNSESIYIKYNGMPYDSIQDAFYNCEDVIKIITGKDIELQNYVDEDTFSINISESGFNTNFGYPIVITGTKVLESDTISMILEFESSEAVITEDAN